MAREFRLSYSEMLPLSLGGLIMFGACSLPAGLLADRWSPQQCKRADGVAISRYTLLRVFAILTVSTIWQARAACRWSRTLTARPAISSNVVVGICLHILSECGATMVRISASFHI
jgi:hypothetical protein